jgi:hypothetical protein
MDTKGKSLTHANTGATLPPDAVSLSRFGAKSAVKAEKKTYMDTKVIH